MSASSPSSPAARRLSSSAAAHRASSRGPSTITSSCPAAATTPLPNAAGGSRSPGPSPVVMPLGATGALTSPDGSGASVTPLGRVGGGGGGGGGGVEEDRRGDVGALSEGCTPNNPSSLVGSPDSGGGALGSSKVDTLREEHSNTMDFNFREESDKAYLLDLLKGLSRRPLGPESLVGAGSPRIPERATASSTRAVGPAG